VGTDAKSFAEFDIFSKNPVRADMNTPLRPTFFSHKKAPFSNKNRKETRPYEPGALPLRHQAFLISMDKILVA
jgi:hypothetical protein